MNFMRVIRFQTIITLGLIIIIICLLGILWDQWRSTEKQQSEGQRSAKRLVRKHPHVLYNSKKEKFYYGVDMPMVFVGGLLRSGTTLMRSMLDAHPDIRCGEETYAILRLLHLRRILRRDRNEWKKLIKNGINETIFNNAFSYYMLEIMAKHGKPSKVLCNKDPYAAIHAEYLSDLYPNSKYVLMVRDGRAIVHSMLKRHVDSYRFDLSSPRVCLQAWNTIIGQMHQQCMGVGEDRCFIMHYEQLVLDPEKWMRKLLNYLHVPWNDSVLHHEQFVGDEVSIHRWDISADQVIKPINTGALAKWVGTYPEDVVRDMAEIAPMLQKLGYDPTANPPNYGVASEIVLKKTEDAVKNDKYWLERLNKLRNSTKVHPLETMFKMENKDKPINTSFAFLDDELTGKIKDNSTDNYEDYFFYF